MRACRFSSVRSGSRAGEGVRERRVVGRHRRRDRQLEQLDAEVRGEQRARPPASLRGVRRGHRSRTVTRSAPSASTAMQRDERRVDPAREAEHDVLEAVLGDVVAQCRGRAPRRPRRRRRSSGATGPPGSPPIGRAASASAPRSAAPAPSRDGAAWRVSRRRAAPAASSRRRRPAAPRRTARARAIDLAVVVDHERVAVEDELVLAADERAEGDRAAVVARALGEHLLALEPLAGVVGRGGDVDDQRARPRSASSRGRRPGLPDVLADREPDGDAVDLDQRRRRRRAGSSAARRRRRSWAGGPCGRSPATAPSASTASAL